LAILDYLRSNPSRHLATIDPVDPKYARRIICTSNAIQMNLLLVVFQTSWILVLVLGYCLARWSSSQAGIFITMATSGFFAFLFCAALLVSAFTYPEYPINQWLCRKVRRSLQSRADETGQFLLDRSMIGDSEFPVVDMIPRDRWQKVAMETAVDIGMIQFGKDGVRIEGDVYRYLLPAESIYEARLESLMPLGWFCSAHMIIIYARTADGPIEIPMTIRDTRFGGLRSSRRRERARAMVEQIQSIARGAEYQSPAPLVDASFAPPEGARSTVQALDTNPYAPPSATW
jgi:hypothetical protein